jgi:hypothetical protein
MDVPDRWQDRIIIVRCPVCWAESRQPCKRMRRIKDKSGKWISVAGSRSMVGFHFPRRIRAMRLGAPKPRGRRTRSVIPIIRLRNMDPPQPKRRKRKPRNPWGL